MKIASLRWILLAAMACKSAPSERPEHELAAVRWVAPADTGPHGLAPGAQARLVDSSPSGMKSYALILRRGDEVATALAEFARRERVVNAHFDAIGAVVDPEVAWFDPAHGQYKGITRHEQMEVLNLSGDIALADNDQPVVHAHVVLGASDGSSWGGHLLRATVSPTLEVFVTSFPDALHKKLDPETGLQLIDLSIVAP